MSSAHRHVDIELAYIYIYIEQIMIEFGLKFNHAVSCCLLDELGVSKLLEVPGLESMC